MCEPLITLTGLSVTGRPGGSKALADAYVRVTQHYRSHHPHLHERVDGSWDKGRSRTRRDRGTGQLLCLHCDQAGEFLDLIEQFEHGDEARAIRGGDLARTSCRSRPAKSPEIAHLGGNADGYSVGGRFSCTVWGLSWGPHAFANQK